MKRRIELPPSLLKSLSSLHGVFGVKKPAGESSASTVERVKKLILSLLFLTPTGEEKPGNAVSKELVRRLKVGHGGTLDPIATGVLIIGVGDGCKRLQSFLQGVQKSYRASGRFGREFDTYDRTGICVSEKPHDHISKERIEAILKEKFTGTIMQRPPAFSAIHVNGQRAYDVARKRQEQLRHHQNQCSESKRAKVEATVVDKATDDVASEKNLGDHPELKLPERQVTISRLELISLALPEFVIEMDCSSGTYVRSLIHDLGEALNSAAAMYELERIAQGSIKLDDCVEVDSLKDLDYLHLLLERHNKD